MKKALQVPEEIWRECRKRAIDEGIPVGQLITQLLVEALKVADEKVGRGK